MEYSGKETDIFLKELFSHLCNIVVAGPLMTSCNDDALMTLQEGLITTLRKCFPITNDRGGKNYRVRVGKLIGIKYCDTESDTICIEIRQCDAKDLTKGQSESPRTSKMILLGLLSSCGSSGQELRKVLKQTNTHLPVCIYAGKSTVWNVVKDELYKTLNCILTKTRFSDIDVKVISGLWMMQKMKLHRFNNKLKCVMKPKTRNGESIDVDVNIINWINVWTSTSQEPDKLLSRRQVSEITRIWDTMLINIIANNGWVDALRDTKVDEIIMSTFYFSAQAKIKLKFCDKASLLPILAYLTAILGGSFNYDVLASCAEEPMPLKPTKSKRQAVTKKLYKKK